MPSDENKSLRDHVTYLLRGGGAHMALDDFVADFPAELCGRKIDGVPYTPWQVMEHIRIAQWDILEFSRNESHQSPKFPDGYWPPASEEGNSDLWLATIAGIHSDVNEMENLVNDSGTHLEARIPWGNGQTILREALLIADHNAYHLGALALMGRILRAK